MNIQTGNMDGFKSKQNNYLEAALLSSLAKSAEILTSENGWSEGINALLEDLGRINNVSRVWIFQILELDSDTITQDYAFEWASHPKYIQLGMQVFRKFTNELGSGDYRKLVESRAKGEWQKVITNKLPDSRLKTSQLEQKIKSMLTLPIMVEQKLWGILGFDDCEREYDWSETEITLLRIATFFISSAVLQNRLSTREKQFEILQKIVSSGAWEYDIKSRHLWSFSDKSSSSGTLLADKHISLSDFLQIVHKDDRKNLFVTVFNFFESHKEVFTHDLRLKQNNGIYNWIEIIGSLSRDSEGNPLKLSGIIISADARKKAELQLKIEAETDSLTGILNRRMFWEKLENQIDKSRNRKNKFSLLIFDIDHFKKVNDTWGHSTGDYILKHFTTICNKELRDGDFFARIGGEEFALILPGSNENIGFNVAERIRKSVKDNSCKVDGHEINITVSAGYVTYKNSEINPQTLYKQADTALYNAKKRGRNKTICFSNIVENTNN